jgi:hypothetical protein
MVEARAAITPEAARESCRVLASSDQAGKTVTLVAYYDTGYFDGRQNSSQVAVKVTAKLPPGKYKLERSDSDWRDRKTTPSGDVAEGTASADLVLAPCHATALTWTRE